jgi:hypothetical protein
MTRRGRIPRVLLVLPALVALHSVAAQDASGLRVGVSRSEVVDRYDSSATTSSPLAPPGERFLDRFPLWSAPIASAILPGLGQARLKQDRFIAYMATEGYLILQYVVNTRQAANNEQDLRSIARTIARRGFVANPPDTVWKYYEQLGEYVESGVFSSATSGPTVPETDPATFNGYQWLLARTTYGISLVDPNASAEPLYGQALAFYESRAVRQPYRWSWQNAQLELDLYLRAINRRNDASRHATNNVVALIANHVLSTVDAFANVRLIQAANGDMHLSASIPVR